MKKVFENEDFFKTVTSTLLENKSVSFLVKGTSMLPFFKSGVTEVFIFKKDEYKRHDVCLFKINDNYVLHRLIRIKNGLYYFRGDHLYNFEIVKSDSIIGSVYKYIENGKMYDVNKFTYKLKLNFFLLTKNIKMVLRKIYLGVRRGK